MIAMLGRSWDIAGHAFTSINTPTNKQRRITTSPLASHLQKSPPRPRHNLLRHRCHHLPPPPPPPPPRKPLHGRMSTKEEYVDSSRNCYKLPAPISLLVCSLSCFCPRSFGATRLPAALTRASGKGTLRPQLLWNVDSLKVFV